MKDTANAVSKKELITLEVSKIGFVVYGIGSGANHVSYRGKILMDFLNELMARMVAVKDELNQAWDSLDRSDLGDPRNLPIIQKFLATGSWAYALTLELQPFTKDCIDGPTDPLRKMFIERLEEIYTKCFAMAHLFGLPDESMVGLQGILTDFEVNGGINHETNEEGAGFSLSLLLYFIAYFYATDREPILYQRFGEAMEAIETRMVARYPATALVFAKHISRLIKETPFGFGSKEIQSEAKTKMLEKLARLQEGVLLAKADEAKAA